MRSSQISERLTTKIRAAINTIQNMNLGTSLLQVADGALNETQKLFDANERAFSSAFC